MLSLHAAQHRANRKRTANGSSHPTASETGKYKAGASKTGTSKASAAKVAAPSAKPRIGLAIAGGGPIGGMYELGALRALDEAIEGLDLTRLDCYVGVSSGAFLAAGLANRMDTAEMCRIFVTGDSADVEFRPETFMRPAFLEYIKRAASFPRLATEWWRELLFSPLEARWSDLITRFGGLIPNGLFDNGEVERFLREVFTRRGRSNDFRELDARLYVVAVDIDSGDAVRFGGDDWNDIPISKAVQASAALPGLYPPVNIRGRHFVDGALRRTMHASVVMDHGVDLMIGINPLVPFNAGRAGTPPTGLDRLASGGLPVVLSQTFRTLLQSRMQVGLAKYAQQYPGIDQMVFEPNEDDGEMFFTNIFSYSSRHRVCEHAFRSTLADLRGRREQLGPILLRHGLRLRDDVLDDHKLSVMDGVGRPRRQTDTTARLRRALDDVGELVRQRHDNRRRKPRARSR
jgi:predicted acylesterase/phospholipase RssA